MYNRSSRSYAHVVQNCDDTSHYADRSRHHPTNLHAFSPYPFTQYQDHLCTERRFISRRPHSYRTIEDSQPPPKPFPVKCKDRITLEGETKEVRKKFSTLLSTVITTFRDANPPEVTTLLSSYDHRYSTLTKQCRNMEDIIQVLAKNITFIDYDLLLFVLEDNDIPVWSQSYRRKSHNAHSKVKLYSRTLQQYLRNRLYEHHKNPDKLKLPVDSQMEIPASDIQQKKRLKFIAESITKKEIELDEVSS